MKIYLFALFFLSILHDGSFCQTINSRGKEIDVKLKEYAKNHLTEKTYLDFDKSNYMPGDTMYFKAYIVTEEKHLPSKISGVLNVILFNSGNETIQRLKLKISQGLTWGDFALPDNLPQGRYRVFAYTRWMLNSKSEGHFSKKIQVGSLIERRPKTLNNLSDSLKNQIDLQFFPEGGALVEGIQSKVAFKAINSNGLGIDVKGEVLDNTGKEITQFETTHLGMGFFEFKPEGGKTYKVKLYYSNGEQKFVNMPDILRKGIVLRINNASSDTAVLQLVTNEDYLLENRGKPLELIVYTSGFINKVKLTLDSTKITLAILKKHLRSGITFVTLFSSVGEPLSERLFFVQNPDQLNIAIVPDKLTYVKREKVGIKLKINNKTDTISQAHLSVSVIDEDKLPLNENLENNILSNFLLTSDLSGYVENPGYYFIHSNEKEVRDNLDLVMLTHGYRKFVWKEVLTDMPTKIKYPPEEGIEISGTAENDFNKPLKKGTISLISRSVGILGSTKTNEQGDFKFTNLNLGDSTKLILQAVSEAGKNSTKIIYNNHSVTEIDSIDIKSTENNFEIPSVQHKKNAERDLSGPSSGIVLKEVNIKQTKKKIIDDNYSSSDLAGAGHADQVIHRNQFKGGGQFSDMFNGLLRGVTFIGGQPNSVPYLTLSIMNSSKSHPPTPMLIVLDGVPLRLNSTVDDINVNTIETIEVLKSANTSIYGMGGGDGVLVITTRHGGESDKDITSTGILPIMVQGFYKAREFYSPKYEHPGDNSTHPDLRSTIYWNPEIATDKDGNASIEYYNADGTGTYRVVVEGIDENGNLGRQVYRYKVTAK